MQVEDVNKVLHGFFPLISEELAFERAKACHPRGAFQLRRQQIVKLRDGTQGGSIGGMQSQMRGGHTQAPLRGGIRMATE